MKRLIGVVFLLHVLVAVSLHYGTAQRHSRAQLYRELRVYITGADSLATRLRWAEGRLDQCRAYY